MSSSSARKAGALQGLSLLLPITLAVMGSAVIAPVIPQLMIAFKGTPGVQFWVPAVVTVPSLCVALFSPLAGALGDRFGRRHLLILCMALYSVFGLAPVFLNDLFAVLATRVGVGVMEAAVMTLSTTLIGDMFQGQARDRWLAAQTGTASIAAVILLMLGGAAGRLGWHGPFVIYALPIVLMLAVVAFTWEPKHEPASSSRGKRSLSWAGFPWAFMLGVCAITLFASVMFYTVQIQLSTALSALGILDPGRIGFLTGVASIGVPLGTVCFWLVAPRLPVAGLLLVAFALMGAGFVGMSQARDQWLFAAASAANQVGAGMILPTLLTFAVRKLPRQVRGRGTGMWQSAFQFGQFGCGLLFPLIGGWTGGVLGSFLALGIAGLAAGLIAGAALLLPRRPQAAEAAADA